MKKNWFRLLEISVILLFGLIPLLWYKVDYMALGHDMSYPLAPLDYVQDRFYTWNERYGAFGSNKTDDLPGLFIHAIEAMSYLLTGSLILSQKLVFIFWFTLPGITMYLLLRSLHPNRQDFVIRLSGSIVYMLNYYLLQGWFIAERTKFSIYAALPIVILIIINVIYRKSSIVKNSILLSLILFFLNGGPGIPLWGGLIIPGIIALIISVFALKEHFVNKFIRTLKFIALTTTLLLLVNIYWVYPYITSFAQNYTQKIETYSPGASAVVWSQSISSNASFINLFKMQGVPDWYNTSTHPYSNIILNQPIFVWLALLFPIIGILGLLKTKNENSEDIFYKRIFLGILLISIPFTAGSHYPTGILYDWALQNIPGFVMFRTPYYKFAMGIWLAYSYLIAIGLSNLISLLKSFSLPKYLIKYMALPILLIFITAWSFYHKPAFNGRFFDWSSEYSTMVKVPDYIFEAKKELENSPYSSRTLMVPGTDYRTKYVTYNWRYFSLGSIPIILTREPVILNDIIVNPTENDFINTIYKEFELNGESKLLRLASANQIVVQNDFKSPEVTEYSQKNLIDGVLSNVTNYPKTEVGEWDFYKIPEDQVKPIIYSPESVNYISSISNNLALLPQISPESIESDALLFANQPNINRDLIGDLSNQNVIVAECKGCDTELALYVDTTPLEFLANDNLYPYVRRFENWKTNSLEDPALVIEYVLPNLARRVGTIGDTYGDYKKQKFVELLVSYINEDFDLISQKYSQLTDEKQKKSAKSKLYQYLSLLTSYARTWQSASPNEVVSTGLKTFSDKAEPFIKGLDYQNASIVNPFELDNKSYSIKIPKQGIYRFNLFDPYNNNKIVNFQGKVINLTSISNKEGWGQSPDITLEEGEYTMLVNNNVYSSAINTPRILLDSKIGETVCEHVPLGKIDSRLSYKINFDITSRGDDLTQTRIVEKNKRLQLKDELKGVFITYLQKGGKDVGEIDYKPSLYTEEADLRFCLRSRTKPTVAEFSNFQIKFIYTNPTIFAISDSLDKKLQTPSQIEFVALNQTKYLVKIKNQPNEFVLNFNSRFDPKWTIRQVDQNIAEKYFSGVPKEYLKGKVKEFERNDNHILTDITFPSRSNKLSSEFILNGYSNAWFINKDNFSQDSEAVYLLEYSQQNSYYKTLAVSITAVILLISIYYYKYVKKSKK